jgi:hypothetical protein
MGLELKKLLCVDPPYLYKVKDAIHVKQIDSFHFSLQREQHAFMLFGAFILTLLMRLEQVARFQTVMLPDRKLSEMVNI